MRAGEQDGHRKIKSTAQTYCLVLPGLVRTQTAAIPVRTHNEEVGEVARGRGEKEPSCCWGPGERAYPGERIKPAQKAGGSCSPVTMGLFLPRASQSGSTSSVT